MRRGHTRGSGRARAGRPARPAPLPEDGSPDAGAPLPREPDIPGPGDGPFPARDRRRPRAGAVPGAVGGRAGRQGVQPLPGNGGRRAVASLRPRAGPASHPGPVTFQRRRLLAAAAALLVITTSSAGLARLSWLVTHASPPARTGTCGVRARPAAGPATQRGPLVTCRHADPLTPPRDFARLGAAVAAWLLRPRHAPLVPQGPDCASLPATTRPASRRPAVHRGRHRIRLVALEQRPDRCHGRDLRRPPGVSASSQATPLIGPADARRPLVRGPDQPAAVAAAPAGRRERQNAN
jgi:hypothetical protein